MTILAALGGTGGILLLVGTAVRIGQGIFRQVAATMENTEAMRELSGQVAGLTSLYNGHEIRITVLEDRIGRKP